MGLWLKEGRKEGEVKALLPGFMQFKTAVDLVRIGRDNDGGYLISKADIKATDTLIGFGINDDWSFESEFSLHKDVSIVAYDASVNKYIFLKKIIKSLGKINNPKDAFHWIKTYYSYLNFFKGNHKHIEKFVGSNVTNNYCSMESVFAETDSSNIFFKIDIEGSEYRILDSLIKNEGRISGMLIEFHDYDLHVERIFNFIENLKMPLVHIHANNYASINGDNNLPLVLELTFSKNAFLEGEGIMPHKLDMPNNKNEEEVTLSFTA